MDFKEFKHSRDWAKFEGLTAKDKEVAFSTKDNHSENSALAIVTCPGFLRVAERALEDYYDEYKCPCGVSVSYHPPISTFRVYGKCPKK